MTDKLICRDCNSIVPIWEAHEGACFTCWNYWNHHEQEREYLDERARTRAEEEGNNG